MQTETYHVQEGDDNHGYDGPLHVSYGGSTYKLADDYIASSRSYAGFEYTTDVNDFHTVNKTCRWPKWINPHTGTRSDAAHGFIHPVRDTQHNLHLLLQKKVVRVIFEGVTAVGIEYVAK
jgi:alcohol oxidase